MIVMRPLTITLINHAKIKTQIHFHFQEEFFKIRNYYSIFYTGVKNFINTKKKHKSFK